MPSRSDRDGRSPSSPRRLSPRMSRPRAGNSTRLPPDWTTSNTGVRSITTPWLSGFDRGAVQMSESRRARDHRLVRPGRSSPVPAPCVHCAGPAERGTGDGGHHPLQRGSPRGAPGTGKTGTTARHPRAGGSGNPLPGALPRPRRPPGGRGGLPRTATMAAPAVTAPQRRCPVSAMRSPTRWCLCQQLGGHSGSAGSCAAVGTTRASVPPDAPSWSGAAACGSVAESCAP